MIQVQIFLKKSVRFPSIVKKKCKAERYEPSVVARYAVDLAQAFNRFYTENRIMVDDEICKKC